MIDENAERHDPGTHSPPRGGEFRLGRARARLGIAISGALGGGGATPATIRWLIGYRRRGTITRGIRMDNTRH